MTYSVGALSDIGRVRKKNEDSYYVNRELGLFILADGMGGQSSGEVASSMAVQSLKHALERNANSYISKEEIQSAFYTANEEIYRYQFTDKSLKSLGTTALLTLINNGRIIIGHVGDSRCYTFSKTELKRQTVDHSMGSYLVQTGKMSEDQSIRNQSSHVLLRALGMERWVEVDIREIPYEGQGLLLCSDGLTKMIPDDNIERILKSQSDPQLASNELAAQANQAGGWDNITIIIVKPQI